VLHEPIRSRRSKSKKKNHIISYQA
jgi:hypothetical protein